MHVLLKPFDDLTVHELYALLRLRSEVFVVEQDCVFLDMDDVDQGAMHALGVVDGEVVACARWYDVEDGRHLGRIVTSPSRRGTGLGREIIARCLDAMGPGEVVMSAQAHLEGLYGSFGFRQVGEGYLEDGIPHIRMVRGPV